MRLRFPFVLVVAAGLVAGRAGAQTPRHPHSYDIQPDSGQFAICVISYMGDNAFQLAYDCVSELRADYKLPAYFYNRSDEARKREDERLSTQREQRWAFYQQMGLEPPKTAHVKKILHIEDQYAVMIAAPSFKDIDAARKALDVIRKLKPPSERLLHKKWVAGNENPGQGEVRQTADNPFLTAFVAPNPVAPKPKANPPDERKDEISLRDWNTGETLSAVHKIPGKWTLVVKAYRGASRLVPQNQERSTVERSSGGRQGNLSEANARMAHQLGEVLRNPQLNFESYVLHMPGMSIVTVGAFDNKDDTRMTAVMTQLGKLHLNIQGGASSSEPLDTPIPWVVPRK